MENWKQLGKGNLEIDKTLEDHLKLFQRYFYLFFQKQNTIYLLAVFLTFIYNCLSAGVFL